MSGFKGPAYYQPGLTHVLPFNPRFTEVSSASQPIQTTATTVTTSAPHSTIPATTLGVMAQLSSQSTPPAASATPVFTPQRDANGKLVGFGMPSNFAPEASLTTQKPEDVTFIPTAPFSAKFNGIVGTATPHCNGIRFTFLDPNSKGVQYYEIS